MDPLSTYSLLDLGNAFINGSAPGFAVLPLLSFQSLVFA